MKNGRVAVSSAKNALGIFMDDFGGNYYAAEKVFIKMPFALGKIGRNLSKRGGTVRDKGKNVQIYRMQFDEKNEKNFLKILTKRRIVI